MIFFFFESGATPVFSGAIGSPARGVRYNNIVLYNISGHS